MFHKIPVINIIHKAFLSSSSFITRDFNEIVHIRNNKEKFLENLEKKAFNAMFDELKNTNLLTGIKFKDEVIKKQENELCFQIMPVTDLENFKNGIPFFGSVINLYKNDVLDAAAFFDVMNQKLYFAKKNEGAFLNNAKIKKYDHEGSLIGYKNFNLNSFYFNFIYFLTGKLSKLHFLHLKKHELDFLNLFCSQLGYEILSEGKTCIVQ